MFSDAYTLVHIYPGIDTPLICLKLHAADMVDPDYRGEVLAKWMMEWHNKAWEDTCKVIDQLIDDNKVVFMDNGKIYPMDYQGEIDNG